MPATASTSPKRTCRLRTSTTGGWFTRRILPAEPRPDWRTVKTSSGGRHASGLRTYRSVAGLRLRGEVWSMGWQLFRDREDDAVDVVDDDFTEPYGEDDA